MLYEQKCKMTSDTNREANEQRWSQGHKARGQGQEHKKKSEAEVKDSLSEDRTSRGQGQGQPFLGQNLSRPRTGMLKAKDRGHRSKRSPKKKGL